jgi:hypothetical protein
MRFAKQAEEKAKTVQVNAEDGRPPAFADDDSSLTNKWMNSHQCVYTDQTSEWAEWERLAADRPQLLKPPTAVNHSKQTGGPEGAAQEDAASQLSGCNIALLVLAAILGPVAVVFVVLHCGGWWPRQDADGSTDEEEEEEDTDTDSSSDEERGSGGTPDGRGSAGIHSHGTPVVVDGIDLRFIDNHYREEHEGSRASDEEEKKRWESEHLLALMPSEDFPV